VPLPLPILLALVVPGLATPPAEDCGLEPPGLAERAPAIAPRRGASPVPPTGTFLRRGPVAAPGSPGALAGKTIYLSAGHGFVWTDLGWRTQRGNTNGLVEDLLTIEAVDQYLVPYLHAMGAYVVTVREVDVQAERVIVDDGAATLEGSPTEGSPDAVGWGEVALPIASDTIAPFESGSARTLVSSAAPTGSLVYAPEIPATGHYQVYVSWVQGPDRAPDAHWVVHHSGGTTEFRLDQRRHGSTWVLLGQFHFEQGADPEAASVRVHDDSASPGTLVSADAVRLGGGMAVHDRGGGTNERPMYEQAARYYTQWNGAPPSVFAPFSPDGTDDVTARSRFSAWEHEAGEDSVYLAFHSNAPNPGQGTATYTYGDSPPPGPLGGFSGVPGSRELQDSVHGEIIGDLRAAWNPDWVDEGRFTAYFGELNPSHNDEMPSILVEVAYHDTPSDAEQLGDPRFRKVVARAMAQGVARYFAERDGLPLVLPPEPPAAVWVRNDGAGGLAVGWRGPDVAPGAGDPADEWVVQVSSNGYGFDDGTVVAGTSHTLEGLEAGEAWFVRVLGSNAGGRSLPSQTVGAAVAPSGQASVLVVGGFDRLDGALLLPDDLSEFDLAIVQRMWLHRINDGSYATRHGDALRILGYSFDGATDDAIEAGDVTLPGYQAVDWFCGEDSVGDLPLSPLHRDALADYLDGGGRVMVSGAELGWSLDENGAADERAFFRERLHARYVLDDAETYDVSDVDGPLSLREPLSFADPTSYDPRFPDVLDGEAGGAVALVYGGAPGMGAAVAWGVGADGERGVLLGFPFETVAGVLPRVDLMRTIMQFFEVVEAPAPDDPDTGGVDDTAGSSGGVVDDAGSGGPSSSATETADTGSAGASGGDDGGCACRASSSPRGAAWWALGLVALARGRRRTVGDPTRTRAPRRRRRARAATARTSPAA
jgi:MYXO-CTERM domain-containing protein